jgi:glutamyl-tRNA reductase
MIVVGLSHHTAPIEVRERLAVAPDEIGATLTRLAQVPHLGEVMLLCTCNRVEIYAASKEGRDRELELELTRWLGEVGGREVTPHLTAARGLDALRHLFRVASSLDSMVVGEPQILGQLKDAWQQASEAGLVATELDTAMRSAVQVARKVRSSTAIGAGMVSVPTVAVDLAQQIFDDLSGRRALLIGAGEMAESAAKLLARGGAELIVVNRSFERAEQLVAVVGGRPMRWDDLADALVLADIVVTSTASPEPVVTRRLLGDLRRRRRGRSLFLIDIAVPRDVEPRVNELDNVYLYDIDDLSNVVAQALEGRAGEAAHAAAIIDEELGRFEQRRAQHSAKPLIVALRERTRAVLASELERTCRARLRSLSDDERRALEAMVEAAVNKLLHAPTTRLKELAGSIEGQEALRLVAELFALDEAAKASAEDAQPAVKAAARVTSLGTGDASEETAALTARALRG